MYSASVIAAYLVNKGIECISPISQMKLQKMVYFAQGVNLATNDAPIIKQTIEAWKYGPVVPIIYSDYKLYGSLPINDVDLIYNFPKDEIKNIDPKSLESLNYTWQATSHLTAEELANWTHIVGSPWQRVYNPNANGVPIPNDLIKSYFVDFLGS